MRLIQYRDIYGQKLSSQILHKRSVSECVMYLNVVVQGLSTGRYDMSTRIYDIVLSLAH